MIIGIDGNEANVVQRVGVNTYAFELLHSLAKLQEMGENPHQLIVYLKNKPLPDMPKEMQNFKYKIIPGSGNWIVTKLTPNLFVDSPRPDVFFSPSHYVPFISPMPRVCSIMDLGYLKYSGQFTKKDFWQLKLWSAISMYVSKGIMAISESTKRDIVRHYPFTKDKVYVSLLAYDKDKFNTGISENDVRRVKKTYSIVDDYVLYIGTLKPSKNIEGLVEAFSKVKSDFPKTKLVIAGKKGWSYQGIFNKVESLGLKDEVVFTDFVSEADKPALVKGAKVLAIPSFWEGFGLDALNAMAVGTPVVAANVGSLPEVVGEAGILVDPGSIDSIARGILEVLSATKSDYNSIVSRGIRQADKFSWDKCARETLKVLENVSRE
jgi:glycosyltransferase involved in cell wall biosynthesis